MAAKLIIILAVRYVAWFSLITNSKWMCVTAAATEPAVILC